MILDKLFGKPSPTDEAAHALYTVVVEHARRPAFFLELGVPDTPDGRFDMIALHAYLVLRRLKGGLPDTADLGQALFDLMFGDIDLNLREMGVTDMTIGRRVKAMASAFFGRVAAYDAALDEKTDDALRDALDRNLYHDAEPAPDHLVRMAAYVRRESEALESQSIDDIAKGRVAFGPPPGDEA